MTVVLVKVTIAKWKGKYFPYKSKWKLDEDGRSKQLNGIVYSYGAKP